MKLPVSPDKPLCNTNRPILHVAYFMKVSKDIEIPIVDADFDMCDNALEVTPPLHCPLPSTFSGYWTENHTESAGILKLFQLIKVSLSLTIMSSIDYDRPRAKSTHIRISAHCANDTSNEFLCFEGDIWNS